MAGITFVTPGQGSFAVARARPAASVSQAVRFASTTAPSTPSRLPVLAASVAVLQLRRSSRAARRRVVVRAEETAEAKVDELVEERLVTDEEQLVTDDFDADSAVTPADADETTAPVADAKGADPKPEKWTCTACGSKNFPKATECHKCGSKKPSEEEMKLFKEKTQLKLDLVKITDDLIRIQADMQNYRRQHSESMSRSERLGKGDALRKLLPLVDDIEAALTAPDDMADGDKSHFTSYAMIFQKVIDAYGKMGVERQVVEVGEKFNPLIHHKAEELEASGEEVPGTILKVLKRGWKSDGSVLVPSDVSIVKESKMQKEAEAAAEDVDSSESAPQEAAAEDSSEGAPQEATSGSEGKGEAATA